MAPNDELKTATHQTSSSDGGDAETGEAGVVNASSPLKRELKGRHMQMIAMGGAIGAGLFVGSGKALGAGGPGAIMICFLIVGTMLLCTIQALAELTVMYPVNGAFFSYMVRFIDPSWGFAIGWDYTMTWLTVLPFEIVVADITIDYWKLPVPKAAWFSIFLVALGVIQIFGVKAFGEVEFVLSIIKILACFMCMIVGIVINTGAVGDQGYLGMKLWSDPGAFKNGFAGFCAVFVTAAFSFGGTELVGLAAAESENPRKAIPKAAKQTIWRILFFYVANLFIIGLVVPNSHPKLISSSEEAFDSSVSPFVIAIDEAKIKVLPHIMNFVIALAVISVANSATFGSTRTMQAMAQRGMGPEVFSYVDKAGRPLWCIIVQFAFGLLAFIACKSGTTVVFNWLLALSGLSYFFIWGSICLAHIRFRHGLKAQDYKLEQLPYRAWGGIAGSWIGVILSFVCLIATLYTSVGYKDIKDEKTGEVIKRVFDAAGFFQGYLAFFVIMALYLGWKLKTGITTGNWKMLIRPEDMDITSGANFLAPGDDEDVVERTWKNMPSRALKALF
ncbi:hypothetical protein OQA88_469 [Cercophora sp. LCS_1]